MIVPIHGIVLAVLLHDRVVLRSDPVPGMVSARTGTYHVNGAARFHRGEQIDAFLDVRSERLTEATPAARFVAGVHDAKITRVLVTGDRVPSFSLVDQRGRFVRLDRFGGKVLLLSFVFTRCPDKYLCPAISAKFAYMQRQLDPRSFHLAEVTLDPRYDSPAILAAYGRQFSADAVHWSLLTGQAMQIGDLIESFGIASSEGWHGTLIHDDRLAIVDRSGTIREIVTTADWNPDDVMARARAIAGLASNPVHRLGFAMLKATMGDVIAICTGGTVSQPSILDDLIFVFGVVAFGGLMALAARFAYLRI
ncbi:MAG TPA: SCO family protein [Candidatus Acidoferrales bacterium]|nr:SCO family protein [Candidatus Acidoferrales bacterium]